MPLYIYIYIYIYIKKKKSAVSHTGLTGSRVDRVSPGQFPRGFLPPPGPVPGPGRPGPGSTRRAGPGFKTLIRMYLPILSFPPFHVLFYRFQLYCTLLMNMTIINDVLYFKF
jgi:hypothetical protein